MQLHLVSSPLPNEEVILNWVWHVCLKSFGSPLWGWWVGRCVNQLYCSSFILWLSWTKSLNGITIENKLEPTVLHLNLFLTVVLQEKVPNKLWLTEMKHAVDLSNILYDPQHIHTGNERILTDSIPLFMLFPFYHIEKKSKNNCMQMERSRCLDWVQVTTDVNTISCPYLFWMHALTFFQMMHNYTSSRLLNFIF